MRLIGKAFSEGQTFNENLNDLKNNYPEFYWNNVEKEEKEEERNRALEDKDYAERILREHKSILEEEPTEDLSTFSSELEMVNDQWIIEQKTERGEVHSIEVEIIPYSTTSKDKKYNYGRIQLTVDPSWVGLKAKIRVFVPQ